MKKRNMLLTALLASWVTTGVVWQHTNPASRLAETDIMDITTFIAEQKQREGLQDISFILTAATSPGVQGDGSVLDSLPTIDQTGRVQTALKSYDPKTPEGKEYKDLRYKELQEMEGALLAIKQTLQNPNEENEKNMQTSLAEASDAYAKAKKYFINHTSSANSNLYK